jgi:AraC-like DNA-binding protein
MDDKVIVGMNRFSFITLVCSPAANNHPTPALPFSKPSSVAGYQDGNSFLRAFKGWTGATPGEYRSDHLNVGLLH